MAWISFVVFDLSSAITGGVFQNLGEALNTLLIQTVPENLGGVASLFAGGLLGILMIVVFPIHWLLQYRPDEPVFAIAMMIPWILVAFISALLWARDMKEGFLMGIKIAVYWMVLGIGIYLLLARVLGAEVPGIDPILTGLTTGLTDLSPIAAIALACLEGGLIGSVFGGLAGAIRYKPNTRYRPKSSRKAKKKDAFGQAYEETEAPAYGSSFQASSDKGSGGDFCTNCGKKLEPGEDFCTNCGTKR